MTQILGTWCNGCARFVDDSNSWNLVQRLRAAHAWTAACTVDGASITAAVLLSSQVLYDASKGACHMFARAVRQPQPSPPPDPAHKLYMQTSARDLCVCETCLRRRLPSGGGGVSRPRRAVQHRLPRLRRHATRAQGDPRAHCARRAGIGAGALLSPLSTVVGPVSLQGTVL